MTVENRTSATKHSASNSLLAFLFAVLFVALIVGLSTNSLQIIIYVGFVGLAHGLLALPVFMFLNETNRVSLLTSALSGYLVGSAPMALLSLPFRGKGSFATVNDVTTIFDGVPTLAGWWHYFLSFSYFGLVGLATGVLFWFALKHYSNNRPNQQSSLFKVPLTWLVIALLSFVLLTPSITKDRSCHNPLRDGSSSISPVLSVFIEIPTTKWNEVKLLFSSFARQNRLSYKDSSELHPGTLNSLYLSLCRESGANISIVEQRWASRDFKHPVSDIEGITVRFYSPNKKDEWRPLASSFVNEIQKKWPNRIIFKGEQGQDIKRSETRLESP